MGAAQKKLKGDDEEEESHSNIAQEIILQDNAKYGEFDQLFSKFDTNTDNLLDERELIAAITHYSYVRPEFKKELNELLSEMETGKAITKQDFREMMSIYTGGDDKDEDIIDVFRIFDKDLNGKLGNEEISHVFGKIGLNLNIEQSSKLVNEADKDKDQQIDFEEFIKIIISK